MQIAPIVLFIDCFTTVSSIKGVKRPFGCLWGSILGPFWFPPGAPRAAFGVLLERLGAPVGLQGCSWDSLGGPSAALGVLWGCAGVYFVDFERAEPGKTSSRLHGVRILQKKGRSRKGHENKLQRSIGICRLRTTHPTH